MKTKLGSILVILVLLVLPQKVYATGEKIFKPFVNYPTGSWPESVAIGDVNGDGKNDVVMTTSYYFNPENDFKLFVFLQTNDGGLASPLKYSTSGSPDSVNICDLNNDGKKDIVVGNDRSNIEVFIQNQSGGLNSSVIYKTANSTSIKTGDFNNDGLMDVAGIGWGSNSLDILLQNNAGSLEAPVTYSVQHDGYDELEAGDVNNDGLTDLIVMSGQGLGPDIGILYQQSSGFSTPAYNYLPYKPSGVAVGDINNDQLNDVIVTYGGNQPNSAIGTFTQNSQGALDTLVSYQAYDCPGTVEVTDVNNDGKEDIVTLHGGWNTLSVYEQYTAESMWATFYNIPYASNYNRQGLALGDINSDGAVDAVVADYNNGLVILYNAFPIPKATTPMNLKTKVLNSSEIQLNWDVSTGAGSYNVYRSNTQNGTYTKVGVSATNTFKDTGLKGSTTYWYKVSATNAGGESTQTSPVSGTTSPAAEGTGIWNFQSNGSTLTPALAWSGVAFPWLNIKEVSGDFNGDGKDDVAAVYNYGNNTTGIWLFNANSTGAAYTARLGWKSTAGTFSWDNCKVSAGDVNGDGKDDIIILYNNGSNTSTLYSFISNGVSLTPTTGWKSNAGAFAWTNSKLVCGDFNGDGRDDAEILYNYGSGTSGIWTFLSNGTTLSPRLSWKSNAGGFAWDKCKIVRANVNGDNKDDIAIMYDYGLNTSGIFTFFSNGVSYTPKLTWKSANGAFAWAKSKLIAADVNGDGKDDPTVLYNYGGNTSGLWAFISNGSTVAPKMIWKSAAGQFSWDKSLLMSGDSNGDKIDDVQVFYSF